MQKFHVGQHIRFYDADNEADIEYLGEVNAIIKRLITDEDYDEDDYHRYQMRFNQVFEDGTVDAGSWWGYTHNITYAEPAWAQKGD